MHYGREFLSIHISVVMVSEGSKGFGKLQRENVWNCSELSPPFWELKREDPSKLFIKINKPRVVISGVLVKHESEPGVHVIVIRVRQLRIGKHSGLGRVITPIFEKDNPVKIDTHVKSLTSFLV